MPRRVGGLIKRVPRIHLNFFRVHLLAFTVLPLIASGVFHGLGRLDDTGTAYIDSLFLCFSAMTTTGLATVNISPLHPTRQVLLLLLFASGDITFVSWIMVLVRKRYFRVHCQNLLDGFELKRLKVAQTMRPIEPLHQRRVDPNAISSPITTRPFRDPVEDVIRSESPAAISETLHPPPVSRLTAKRTLLRSRTMGYETRRETVPLPKPTVQRHAGMGGVALSTLIMRRLADWIPGKAAHKGPMLLRRETLVDDDGDSISLKQEVASWLPEGLENLIIGRNGRFYTEELEDEELEQIGGVEYRALRFLSYFVAAYIFLCQVLPFTAIAIHLARSRDFSPYQQQQGVQEGSVSAYWSSLFNVVSAFTGTGMSLVDQSMVPLASTYIIVYAIIATMLIGNHAMPMILRFSIWVMSKVAWKQEQRSTLNFLLDHPRRCFLYLFPSHQTWYLLFVLIVFIIVEMIGYLVLNIGLPILEDINSGWQRFTNGLFQSLAVRASGLSIVAVANLAPSTLILYIVLMYVAIYPIALSVRSTNVYEEQSLGVFEKEESDEEPLLKGKDDIFGTYLMWHVRRQVAFDAWPLAAAIFTICCFERGRILGEDSAWFSLFRILFECTSGYALIGLSLGTANNNFSFCGEWSTPSKLVLILLMLRGRHRGLPVAIDRAIMLPKVFSRVGQGQREDQEDEE